MNKNNLFSTKGLVELSLFCAIIFVLGLTPFGYIPTPAFNIVTVHVPVIIGSIVLGWRKGLILGFVFGLTSFITTMIRPNAMSLFFSPLISGNLLSLVVCFLPRMLVGIVPYFVFSFFKKSNKAIKKIGLILSGALGSITNTVFVMGFIYVFFGEKYAEIIGNSFDTIIKVMIASVGVSASAEAIVASIFTFAICNILIKVRK